VRRVAFFGAATAITTLILCARQSSADIPRPTHFRPSTAQPGYSEWVLAVSADNSIERGQQERPVGSVFATEGYCRVRLEILAANGAKAILNVMGSSEPGAIFGGPEWTPELPPLQINVKSANWASISTDVPVRHSAIEFFLSTADKPSVPDVGASVGGPILVWAAAIADRPKCNVGQ
jgi:hypothetical protein